MKKLLLFLFHLPLPSRQSNKEVTHKSWSQSAEKEQLLRSYFILQNLSHEVKAFRELRF